LKALIDTSVLVAGIIRTHTDHQRALPVMKQIRHGQLDAVISAHSLAECYAVITRMPPPPRLSPPQTWQLIQRDVLSLMTVFALTANDYRDLIEHLAQNNIAGGVTYDAVIAWAAVKTQVDQIITLNAKDFRRVVPALAAKVVIP